MIFLSEEPETTIWTGEQEQTLIIYTSEMESIRLMTMNMGQEPLRIRLSLERALGLRI